MNYTYDAMDNLLTATDRLGNETSYGYDQLYRQTSVTNANDEETLYGYDLVGNLKTLTDPELNTTTWFYDGLDRVIEEENELGDSRFYQYDAASNLIEKIDRNERLTEYEYDHLHRLIEERWKDGVNTVRTIGYEYDLGNQLTQVADPDAEYDYVYDGLGRTTNITADLAGLTPEVVLAQAFNANGQRTSLASAIGGTADFENSYWYDNLNRLTQVTQRGVFGGHAVAEKLVHFTYKADGQFDTITSYADQFATENVGWSTYGYDGAGRLTSQTYSSSVGSFGYTWQWDAANRITSFTSSLYSAENATYSYDDAGQLTDADRSGTTYGPFGKKCPTSYLNSSATQHLKKIPCMSSGRRGIDCSLRRASCCNSSLLFAWWLASS